MAPYSRTLCAFWSLVGGTDPFSQVPFLMHPFVRCLGFSSNRFASSGLEMLEGCVAKLDTRAALYKGCMCNDQIITRRYNDRGAVLAQGARFPAGKATARGGKVVFMRGDGRKESSYHKYKVLGVPPQNGRCRTGAESGHEAPLSMYLVGSSSVSGKGYTDKGNSLAMHPSEARPLSAHHLDKKR